MILKLISLILIFATSSSAQCESGKFLSHPESYEKFLLCIGGVYFELVCPFGLRFNWAINECDCPGNVNSIGNYETAYGCNTTTSTYQATASNIQSATPDCNTTIDRK